MKVELISVGTELLLGNIVNTNANFLSKKCAELGLSLYYQVTVGDNMERLCAVIQKALSRSDILILTGGLGPTQDDLTKEAVAKALDKKLIMDEPSRERILSYFNGLQYNETKNINGNLAGNLALITENNWKQALKLENCIVLNNDNGTAPGYIVEDQGKIIILLPGPPNEMIPMYNTRVFPYLQKLTDRVFVSRMIKVCGIGESKAETVILDLLNNQVNPTIAPYAKTGEVNFRITASAADQSEAEKLLMPIVEELKKRFGNNIYTIYEDETLEEVIVKMLKAQSYTLTTAESCTGGLLAGRIVNVPKASEVFHEGFITYSDDAKKKYLGVKEDTLQRFGAVSKETAAEMARGAAESSGSDIAIAITGIAGPDGGTPEKPIGLVYIACFLDGEVNVNEFRLRGNRTTVRERCVIHALDLIRRMLLK